MAEEKSQTAEAVSPDPGLLAAFSGPAPMINKIYLTLSAVSGRLAFVEYPPSGLTSPPQYRAAVTMNIGDLVSLRDLLIEMLKDVQQLPSEGGDAPKG